MTTSAFAPDGPPPALSKLLHAAGILAGSVKGSVAVKASVPGKEAQLVDLLVARLASARAVLPGEWLDFSSLTVQDDALDEDSVKLATAELAMALLLALQSAEEDEKAKLPDGPANAEAPPAPVFGSRDIKIIQTLSTLVARWGLAAPVQSGVLPAEMQDKPVKAQAKIAEIDEGMENLRSQHLESCTAHCATLLLPEKKGGQLQAISLPLLLVPTLAALLQLSHEDHTDKLSEKRLHGLLSLWVVPVDSLLPALIKQCMQCQSFHRNGISIHLASRVEAGFQPSRLAF